MTPTEINVNGIPFVMRDLKRELSGKLTLRALAALNLLSKNDTVLRLLAADSIRISAADIVRLIGAAPDILGSEEFKDLVDVLFVPKDPTLEAYTKLTVAERRDLALDVPLFPAWEAIKSFFASTKSAAENSPTTSAETP